MMMIMKKLPSIDFLIIIIAIASVGLILALYSYYQITELKDCVNHADSIGKTNPDLGFQLMRGCITVGEHAGNIVVRPPVTAFH